MAVITKIAKDIFNKVMNSGAIGKVVKTVKGIIRKVKHLNLTFGHTLSSFQKGNYCSCLARCMKWGWA